MYKCVGKFLGTSSVPTEKFFKPLDVQDYILAIHFKFEIKIPLNQLREELVVAFFLPPFSTILGLNRINMR